MKIYTRTGDKGSTSLVGGSRVSKCDDRLESYGAVDELMAHLGHLYDKISVCEADGKEFHGHAPEIKESILEILDRLMSMASLLAAEDSTAKKLPQLSAEDVSRLEQWTDKLLDGLPSLTRFTLPLGHVLVSYTHVCRTVCRRAERCIVRSSASCDNATPQVEAYINRLSDYLYALGRRATFDLNVSEVAWEPRKEK